MDVKVVDYTEPLENEKHENFIQEFIRLQITGEVQNERQRKIVAYTKAYPESVGTPDYQVCSKASDLLNMDKIKYRIRHILENEGTEIEYELRWSQNVAEAKLMEIILDENEKTNIKLKAIEMMNNLRKIGEEVVEEEVDTVTAFVMKLKGK